MALRLFLFLLCGSLIMGCQKNPELKALNRLGLLKLPDRIHVRISKYCPRPGHSYRDLFVRNLSAVVREGSLHRDADTDGVSDDIEDLQVIIDELRISSGLVDSNSDYFNDLLIYLAGISFSEQANLQGRCLSGMVDSDRDGLLDCEESRLTRTDLNRADSDFDGIPDSLELRCGLNPMNPSDAILDLDHDGLTNIEDCKRGTPIDETNLKIAVAQFESHYALEALADAAGCYQLEVRDIAVLKGPPGYQSAIAFYLLEEDASGTLRLFNDQFPSDNSNVGQTIETDETVNWQPDYPGSLTGWRWVP